MPTAQVTDVVLDRETALQVEYDDGVIACFPVGELREACPCAECRGRRESGRPVVSVVSAAPAPPIVAVQAELHGNWGIAIEWSDGHDTGIYSWEHLRERWDARAGR